MDIEDVSVASRLDEIPVYQRLNDALAAEDFNLARLALLRLGSPWRLQLAGLRNLDLLLERAAWICVDRSLNDIPVLAWTHFESPRTALHKPVGCELRYYHAHAALIRDKVLAGMRTSLAEQFSQADSDRLEVIA